MLTELNIYSLFCFSHGTELTERLELEAAVLSACAGEADPGQLRPVHQGEAELSVRGVEVVRVPVGVVSPEGKSRII